MGTNLAAISPGLAIMAIMIWRALQKIRYYFGFSWIWPPKFVSLKDIRNKVTHNHMPGLTEFHPQIKLLQLWPLPWRSGYLEERGYVPLNNQIWIHFTGPSLTHQTHPLADQLSVPSPRSYHSCQVIWLQLAAPYSLGHNLLSDQACPIDSSYCRHLV